METTPPLIVHNEAIPDPCFRIQELPPGLTGRLRHWMRTASEFSFAMGELEALGEEASLPPEMTRRFATAVRVRQDLDQLVAAAGRTASSREKLARFVTPPEGEERQIESLLSWLLTQPPRRAETIVQLLMLEFLGRRRVEHGATEADELELLAVRETTNLTVEETLP